MKSKEVKPIFSFLFVQFLVIQKPVSRILNSFLNLLNFLKVGGILEVRIFRLLRMVLSYKVNLTLHPSNSENSVISEGKFRDVTLIPHIPFHISSR
jgi:hypothetical protein